MIFKSAIFYTKLNCSCDSMEKADMWFSQSWGLPGEEDSEIGIKWTVNICKEVINEPWIGR